MIKINSVNKPISPYLKDLYSTIVLVVCTFFFIFLLLAFSNCVHASGDVPITRTYPYELEDNDSFNDWWNSLSSSILSDQDVSNVISNSDYVLVPYDFDYYGYWDDWSYWRIYLFAIPIDSFDNPVNSDYTSNSLDFDTVSGSSIYSFTVWYDERGNHPTSISDFSSGANVSNFDFFGTINSTSFDSYYGVRGYPVYWSKNFYSINNGLILKYQEVVPDITGHATQPNNDPNNFINGSNNQPIAHPTKPTPNIFNPITWNPPSIDTSTIETLLKSIWECLEYGFSYLKDNLFGWFNNLLSNLDSWFGYVVDSVYYAANKIVQSIQDLATDLYNNFVSLFEPIYNYLSGVSTLFNTLVSIGTDENGFSITTLISGLFVPSASDLDAFVSDSDTFDLIGMSEDILTNVRSIFTTLQGLHAIKIIHIPNVYFHGLNIGGYDIDFGWYDNFKALGDGIISAFLIFNYIFFLFFRLPSYIRGQGGDFNRDIQLAHDTGVLK